MPRPFDGIVGRAERAVRGRAGERGDAAGADRERGRPDARPLLRAMDLGRPDPAPAAPDGDRDRQSADLGADPQSAAAPSRRDLCGSDRVRADRRQRHLHVRAAGRASRSATPRSARWSRISATTRSGCRSPSSSATRCAPRPRWSASRTRKSRPEAGIVTFEHRMFNQKDELVCVMERTALMQRRGA